MIKWLIWLLWGPPPHDCSVHGHKYFARYDQFIDPRLTADQIKQHFYGTIDARRYLVRKSLLATIYVKDICRHCGDVVDRIEGLNAMEILAHQAKRMG